MTKLFFTLAAMSLLVASSYATALENHETYVPVSTYEMDENNETLSSFCKAIVKGDLKMVQQLIDLGEDINQKSLGKTPAMYAARYNKVEILTLLIENGADLSMRSSKERYTAKKFAELSNAKESLMLLEKSSK